MIKCKRCGRTPELIAEYVQYSRDYGCTPTEYIRLEEGTYNDETGLFYCTSCYIKSGMPAWRA